MTTNAKRLSPLFIRYPKSSVWSPGVRWSWLDYEKGEPDRLIGGPDIDLHAMAKSAAQRFVSRGVRGRIRAQGCEPDGEPVALLPPSISIVGIERTSFGYYAANLEHERAAASGPVAGTVIRPWRR